MKKHKLFFTITLFFVQLLLFAQSKAEEFKAFKTKYSSKAFDYTEAPPKPKVERDIEPGFLAKLLMKIGEILYSFPWKEIFIIAIVSFIVFLIFRVYKNGGVFVKNSKKLYQDVDFDYIENNLAEVNLDQLIKKAEDEQKFALAIRYLHYQNLQNLDQKQLIEWDTKKTNQQFISQIKHDDIRNQFATNTKVFNQVWFGDFEIDLIKYQEFKTMFNQFNQNL